MMRRVCLALVLIAAGGNSPAASAPIATAVDAVCASIETASQRYRLPVAYFTRLIWQESRFEAGALSPAGAQGVAQFMPETAAERGLADPFSTPDAIDHSAHYLADLRGFFGNLGLAAAAYNAGPGRVARWLAGVAGLPSETTAYVPIVTGYSAEDWRGSKVPDIDTPAMFSCRRFVAAAGPSAGLGRASPPPAPGKAWAVILVGSPRRDKAIEEFAKVQGQFSGVLGGQEPSVVHKRIGGLTVPRYIVQIEHDTRGGANSFCARLKQAGGNCIVLLNRR